MSEREREALEQVFKMIDVWVDSLRYADHPVVDQVKVCDALYSYADAREAAARSDEREKCKAEIERLSSWLQKIEGGDNPCRDESQLRQWAYEAVTLSRRVEDTTP